jgi:hypothetical protein
MLKDAAAIAGAEDAQEPRGAPEDRGMMDGSCVGVFRAELGVMAMEEDPWPAGRIETW